MRIRDYGPYNAETLLKLYDSVGWTNYTGRPDMLRAAYARSLCALGAYEGDELLGVIRAVGDGCSIVLVQDLLVFPRRQRAGVGTALLRALMERYPDVYQLQLVTDDTPEHAAFYESLGFSRASDWGCAAYMKL